MQLKSVQPDCKEPRPSDEDGDSGDEKEKSGKNGKKDSDNPDREKQNAEADHSNFSNNRTPVAILSVVVEVDESIPRFAVADPRHRLTHLVEESHRAQSIPGHLPGHRVHAACWRFLPRLPHSSRSIHRLCGVRMAAGRRSLLQHAMLRESTRRIGSSERFHFPPARSRPLPDIPNASVRDHRSAQMKDEKGGHTVGEASRTADESVSETRSDELGPGLVTCPIQVKPILDKEFRPWFARLIDERRPYVDKPETIIPSGKG